MSIARRFTTAAAVLFAAAGSLAAQSASSGASEEPQVPVVAAPVADQTPVATPAEAQVSLAPFADKATVGVRQLSPAPSSPYATPPREHVGSNVALMIVGGATLVVGAIIGGTAGTIVMVGGGVIGLVGLYRYLQ